MGRVGECVYVCVYLSGVGGHDLVHFEIIYHSLTF